MCDQHLCDKVIRAIFEAGPRGLSVLPLEIILHLAMCDECVEKLGELIALSVTPPVSERAM